MTDITHEINAVARRVGDRELEAGAARTVTLSRAYPTTVEDLWEACTSSERIPRWFLPVSGDLRAGGRFQLEGNAGGTIERCDPPRSFAATWEFGEATSWILVSFAAEPAGGARVTLEHTMSVEDGGHWAQYGPGAVGIGWELGLYGLGLHLASGSAERIDEAAWAASDEGRAFITGSGEAWRDAAVAAGEDPSAAAEAATRTIGFYTGT